MRTIVSRQCSLSSRVAEPLIVEPDAAGEADAAVDDENLPVGAIVQLLERYQLGLAELADLDAGGARGARATPSRSCRTPSRRRPG